MVFGNAAQTYLEAAWLTTQFGSNSSHYLDLQYALWFLMNPNLTKYDTAGAQVWLNLAAQDYSSIDPDNFSIITNTSSANNPLALTGQVQEFIVSNAGTRHICDVLFAEYSFLRCVFSVAAS